MNQYQQLLHRVLTEGVRVDDRTGVGTVAVFGALLQYDLRERFPVEQAKATNWRTAFLEMLFFLSGETNVRWLNERGSKLWDPWADENGNLGPVYGDQWRSWRGYSGKHDQVETVIDEAKTNPGSRHLIVEGWNVGELRDMALRPCHKSHQLSCTTPGYVDMLVYQRSWDLGLGCPFNIAQYALLLHLYARAIGGRTPRYLRFVVGDAHIYWNHIDKLTEVAQRQVVADEARLVIDTDNTDIDGYDISHFSVVGYGPQPAVKLEVAV